MVVYLTKNKLAQVALGNCGLVVTLAMGRLIRAIFLGQLRDIEVEVSETRQNLLWRD